MTESAHQILVVKSEKCDAFEKLRLNTFFSASWVTWSVSVCNSSLTSPVPSIWEEVTAAVVAALSLNVIVLSSAAGLNLPSTSNPAATLGPPSLLQPTLVQSPRLSYQSTKVPFCQRGPQSHQDNIKAVSGLLQSSKLMLHVKSVCTSISNRDVLLKQWIVYLADSSRSISLAGILPVWLII